MKRIHMMGISGSGMSGVAILASKMGYEVTGCDLKSGGHDELHLHNIDLLVVSPAILYQNSTHPEFIKAKDIGIVMTWEEFLGKVLAKDKKIIAIAGTHGKSTTTAMVGEMLEDNGFDPLVMCGASITKWNGNSRFGNGEYFIVEADEFNDNFLNYNPEIIVINNIEFDHPDYFEDEKQLRESFDKFIARLVGQKILFTEKDNLNIKFNLQILGEHNQKNANMAYLVGRQLKIKKEEIIKSLENFSGIGRRMELIKNRNVNPDLIGVKIYDDYAHHPTAIKTTLAGLREKYPLAKILAVVEPHGYKRTKALLPLYKNVFNAVDEVIVGPIYKARDEIDSSISPDDIVKVSSHKNIKAVSDIENCKLKISNYDVIVFMGAGNSSLWAHEIIELS